MYHKFYCKRDGFSRYVIAERTQAPFEDDEREIKWTDFKDFFREREKKWTDFIKIWVGFVLCYGTSLAINGAKNDK